MSRFAATAAFILLAACGSKNEAGNNSTDAAPGAAQEQTPPELTVDNSSIVVPIAAPSPSPLGGLPPGFAGRWGAVSGDCDAKDAKGLLTIAGNMLTVRGSSATARAATRIGPDKVTVDLADAGQRPNVHRTATLTLQDDGKTLVLEQPQAPISSTYSRCPA